MKRSEQLQLNKINTENKFVKLHGYFKIKAA